MKKYTPEELQEMFRALPKDIQDAIFSLDVSEKINTIGRKNSLTVDQLGEFGSEIGLVLLGATKVSEFVDNLAERLKVSKDYALRLAGATNTEIFSPIRSSLEKVQGVRDLRFSEAPSTDVPRPFGATPEVKKEDILKVIEDDKGKKEAIIMSIFGGTKAPVAPVVPTPQTQVTPAPVIPTPVVPPATTNQIPTVSPFEAKTDQSIFRNPPETTKYTQATPKTDVTYQGKVDPYRELPN